MANRARPTIRTPVLFDYSTVRLQVVDLQWNPHFPWTVLSSNTPPDQLDDGSATSGGAALQVCVENETAGKLRKLQRRIVSV